MEGPNIFLYQSFRKYLRDWYEWMKKVRPEFSYRAFSAWAGFKSPNQLLLVIQGRRNLALASLDRYLKVLKLKKTERRYFELLVRFEQARTTEARLNTFRELSAYHLKHGSLLKGRQLEYLSNWYYSAIREMVNLQGFRESGPWIAKRLKGRIDAAQAREAIDLLLDLGLLTRDAPKQLKQSASYVTTGDETDALAAVAYHDQMMQMARHALLHVNPRHRNLTALTFTIRDNDYPFVVDDINEFRKKLVASLENREEKQNDNCLYQLNIHLVPIVRD